RNLYLRRAAEFKLRKCIRFDGAVAIRSSNGRCADNQRLRAVLIRQMDAQARSADADFQSVANGLVLNHDRLCRRGLQVNAPGADPMICVGCRRGSRNTKAQRHEDTKKDSIDLHRMTPSAGFPSGVVPFRLLSVHEYSMSSQSGFRAYVILRT